MTRRAQKNFFTRLLNNYMRNRLVNINTNIILGSAPGIFAAAWASSILASRGYSPNAITLAAIIVDWFMYLAVHGALHFFSNRKRYVDRKGVLHMRAYWIDLWHVHLSSMPSTIMFYVLAAPTHNLLMRLTKLSAGAANLVAYWSVLVCTRTWHIVQEKLRNSDLFDDKKHV